MSSCNSDAGDMLRFGIRDNLWQARNGLSLDIHSPNTYLLDPAYKAGAFAAVSALLAEGGVHATPAQPASPLLAAAQSILLRAVQARFVSEVTIPADTAALFARYAKTRGFPTFVLKQTLLALEVSPDLCPYRVDAYYSPYRQGFGAPSSTAGEDKRLIWCSPAGEGYSNGFPVYIDTSRRSILDAAPSGHVLVPHLYFRRFLRLLRQSIPEGLVPLRYHSGGDPVTIGTLPRRGVAPPVQCGPAFSLAVADAQAIAHGAHRNTGIILWGPPGNGKSYYLRWLASYLGVPLTVVDLRQFNDLSLVSAWNAFPSPSLIVFEDFDSYFKGRVFQSTDDGPSYPRYGGGGMGSSLSFSTLLNLLDGNMARRTGLIVCLTTNDMDSVDPALANRPGRFAHSLFFGNPDEMETFRLFSGYPNAEEVARDAGVCCTSLDDMVNYRARRFPDGPPPVVRPKGVPRA